MAFAVAVQAGDAKKPAAKDQDKPACCPSKVKTSDQAKAGACPMAQCGGCKQKQVKQTGLPSPKAAEAARK